MTYTIGLDLGQSNDYTAYAIVSQEIKEQPYHVEKMGRWRGIAYTEIVSKIVSICKAPKLKGNKLVIDFTGVGRPVYDMFVAAKLSPIGISITGGKEVTGSGNIKNVPKEILMSFTKVLFQNHNIIIHKGPYRDILKQELSNIEYKQSDATGHTSYGAWRSGSHDDLLLAVELACWQCDASSKSQPISINWENIRPETCKSGLEGGYSFMTGGSNPDDPYGLLSDDYYD